MKRIVWVGICAWLCSSLLMAQPGGQDAPRYTIAGIDVVGASISDKNAIISLSGLKKGETISVPGIQISDAIKRLWGENIFSDISVKADNIVGKEIFLVIEVKERARISQFSFQGINKSQADDLREKINFIRGTILTESKQQSAKRVIRNYYVEKGFYNTSVVIVEKPDKILKNGVVVNFKVDKGNRIKIEELNIIGNEAFTDAKFKRKLKKVNERTWWRFWAPSKFIPKQYKEAKDGPEGIITAYNDLGYRDAQIVRDTVYALNEKRVRVELQIDEGKKYYHRNINWVGNYQYNSEILQQVLGINSGDIYASSAVQARLFGDPNGGDVSSLYLDNGYLFFNLEPVEVAIVGDSIDLEMRITEGPQASIRKVPLTGNTKTSDFVVIRELRTNPGDKFSRADIIRSQREILALNYFDQEKLGVSPIPDQNTGTVDIAYAVEERPSDQLNLTGGWSPRQTINGITYGGFIGTVQLSFNNFASRRVFDIDAWRPVPSGDGQRVSLAFQANGQTFKNLSFTFQEPWLGGKKPNSLGISINNLSQRFGALGNNIFQTSIDYGARLKFPDDFFTSRTSFAYKYYNIDQPSRLFGGFDPEDTKAYINIFTIKQSFDRSSVDAPIYPRSGSIMSFSVEATTHYSLFRRNVDFQELPATQRYNFLEYHKWRFLANWYFRIVDNLVLNAKVEGGYLGAFNKNYGVPPFERFILGGAGLGAFNFNFDGREILPLRGYDENTIGNTDSETGRRNGYPIYNRMVLELRYPISLNQSAPVWVQAFLEGGNGFQNFREYNPLNLRRSAGVGLRAMLPMVGLLGIDWAYGFDEANDTEINPGISGSQFHFILGQQF